MTRTKREQLHPVAKITLSIWLVLTIIYTALSFTGYLFFGDMLTDNKNWFTHSLFGALTHAFIAIDLSLVTYIALMALIRKKYLVETSNKDIYNNATVEATIATVVISLITYIIIIIIHYC